MDAERKLPESVKLVDLMSPNEIARARYRIKGGWLEEGEHVANLIRYIVFDSMRTGDDDPPSVTFCDATIEDDAFTTLETQGD